MNTEVLDWRATCAPDQGQHRPASPTQGSNISPMALMHVPSIAHTTPNLNNTNASGELAYTAVLSLRLVGARSVLAGQNGA